MSKPLLKKEIAEMSGISDRTMRRRWSVWAWIEKHRTKMPGRPTYNRKGVMTELALRKVL